MLEDVGQWEVKQDAVRVFCEEGTFLFGQLGKGEMRSLLSRSAKECFGEAVGFELCTAKRLNDSRTKDPGGREREGGKARPSPSLVEEAENDQTVKAALEVFHGTIRDVKLFGPDGGEEEA